jgi:site-specific DNA recombinase
MERRVAAYARVSTERQAESQTIEQQVERLRAYAGERGWPLPAERIYKDDGHSGARLDRPALDRLRDAVTRGEVELVLITSPDRLARRYAYQVWLLEECERAGCEVVFLDRPPTGDPQDALVLQIRGAVAEYERTVIADRMRRGRLAALQAGRLLPWSTPPFGYRLDSLRPRDPAGVRIEESEAAVVRRIFAWYIEEGLTLYGIAQRLVAEGIPTPTGRPTTASPDWARAADRRWRVVSAPAQGGLDRGARAADRVRGTLRPGPGAARPQPAVGHPQHAGRVPLASVAQLSPLRVSPQCLDQ